jgi:hypothetical protein
LLRQVRDRLFYFNRVQLFAPFLRRGSADSFLRSAA